MRYVVVLGCLLLTTPALAIKAYFVGQATIQASVGEKIDETSGKVEYMIKSDLRGHAFKLVLIPDENGDPIEFSALMKEEDDGRIELYRFDSIDGKRQIGSGSRAGATYKLEFELIRLAGGLSWDQAREVKVGDVKIEKTFNNNDNMPVLPRGKENIDIKFALTGEFMNIAFEANLLFDKEKSVRCEENSSGRAGRDC